MSDSAAIRVAYCIDMFALGGTELNAIRTLEAMDRQRFDVTVFYFSERGPLRERYRALGVRMIHLPISGLFSLKTLRQGLRFGLLLRKLGIQIVHTHDVYTNIFAVPWARTVGNCRVIASRRWFYDVPRPALNILNRWSYRFANRVLANSESVLRLLIQREGVPESKVVEIPNFLGDRAFILESVELRREQRRTWGVPEGVFVVGAMSRLVPVKNLEMLIRAVQGMLDDTHLVLIGEGPDRKNLERLCAEVGMVERVHFAGAIISLSNLHQHFDVSVLCSLSEGFPNSIIEALAVCRPVVATRVGGVADVVEHGVTGLLVESGAVAELTESLKVLRSDPVMCERLGFAGRRRVRARYSQQLIMSNLQLLYEQLAQNGAESTVGTR